MSNTHASYCQNSTSGHIIQNEKSKKLFFAQTVSGNPAFLSAHYFLMNRQNLEFHAHAPKILVLEFMNSFLFLLHSFKMLWRSFMHRWHDGVPTFFKVFMVSPFHSTLISMLSLINLRTSRELEKVLQCCAKWIDMALAQPFWNIKNEQNTVCKTSYRQGTCANT